MNGSTVHIDVLCCDGVSVTPLRYHSSGFNQLKGLRSHPRLVVRPEFETLDEALSTMRHSSIPTDGVICIEEDTSITYRMEAPTVDLMSNGVRMRFIGDRGTDLAFESQPGMRRGCVYECTLGYEPPHLSLVSWTPRFDKLVPNRREVVDSVVARAMGVVDEGSGKAGGRTEKH